MYDFDIRKTGSDTTGVDILLYGEANLLGTHASVLYRYWAANKNGNGQNYSVTKSETRFMRMYGTDVLVHGSFELRGQELYNHGKPFTLNIGGTNAETYEFLRQKLSIDSSHSGSKLIGSSLMWVFEPDNNHSTTFLASYNFKLWKLT